MYKELKDNLTVSEDKSAFLLKGRVVFGIMQVRVYLPLKNSLCNIPYLPTRVDSKTFIANCHFCLTHKCK